MGIGGKIAIGVGVFAAAWVGVTLISRVRQGCPVFAGANDNPNVINPPGVPHCPPLDARQLLIGPLALIGPLK